MDQVSVDDPQILVLAPGDTKSSIANSRGHLFEEFVAQILHSYGYEKPTTSHLNVTSDGIELDVVATHRLSGAKAIAECKAYSTNVHAQAVTSFYGKLGMERYDSPNCHGFFFALPRLTAQGVEQAKKMTERDPHFTYVDSVRVAHIVEDLGLTDAPRADGFLYSDYAVLVTPEGVYAARKTINPTDRTARNVIVWAASGHQVPDPIMDLIADSMYSNGLPVLQQDAPTQVTTSRAGSNIDQPPLVVEVKGSGSDFEYQLPASPKYFVGRKKVLRDIESVFEGRHGGVVVLNAQSGWGKSSLALRTKQLVEAGGGAAIVVDSRTADSPDFVVHALRRLALQADSLKICKLPDDASYASLQSALATLGRADWLKDSSVLLIFFDQFENVFRDFELTAAFRNLALGISELASPIYLGFAWKTDLVGWTEDHPYRLRDEIRSTATVINLPPLGAREIDTLLNRLQKAVGEKLYPDVRQRLREYSQGLPWLFKKLAGHLLREVQNGVSQAELVGEALNVKNLFEADLAQLTPGETEALRHIARYAPIPLSEAMERVTAPVMQSLIDRRLVVSVGEQIDTYWDIFRDFLNTGTVPIQETYIIRQGPRSVVRLLEVTVQAGGELTLGEAATLLNVSEPAVINLARELRLLGALVYAPNKVKVSTEFSATNEPEETLRERVSTILKRHRAYSIFQKLSERNAGVVSVSSLAEQLPYSFPAVEVSPKTWDQYTRAFASWFDFAGLAWFDSQALSSRDEHQTRPKHRSPISRSNKDRPVFPSRAVGALVLTIDEYRGHEFEPRTLERKTQKNLSDLRQLGLLKAGGRSGFLTIDEDIYGQDGAISKAILLDRLQEVPGISEGLELIESDPSASAAAVGRLVNDVSVADWSETSQQTAGKYLRGWAKYLGFRTVYPEASKRRDPGEQ